MKKVDSITINKEEHSTQLTNILYQCKLTFPSTDEIQKLSVGDVDRIEVKIFKKETT